MEVTWVLLQSLALLAILFTPIWIRPSEGSLGERLINVPYAESATAARRPTSITSQVIPIPGSGFRRKLSQGDEWSEEMESGTRQIRFEWAAGSEVPENWKLSSIMHKNERGQWEDVSLLRNEFGVPIGSSYVELTQGENLFAAHVVDSKTRKQKRILLHVAQKR